MSFMARAGVVRRVSWGPACCFVHLLAAAAVLTVPVAASAQAGSVEQRLSKLERLQARRDELFHSMRADLDRSFREAHAEIAGVIRTLQRGGTAQAAAQARDAIATRP